MNEEAIDQVTDSSTYNEVQHSTNFNQGNTKHY